jgi:hypothetical protein
MGDREDASASEPVEGSESAAAALSDRAGVSVIWKGPFYSGGQIDTTLRLEGDRLRIAVEPQELGPFKKGAVKRLFGDSAPDQLGAGEPVELEFPVTEAKVSFPGKRGVLVELPGKPKFGVSFFQWSERAESGSPGAATIEAGQAMFGKGGRKARERREQWREALERAGAL